MPSFGTDGMRGVANAELTPELVLSLGRAAAQVLGTGPWIVGRDTRASGPMLQAALSAGLAAAGASIVDVGVLPTPGVAHACAARGLPGAVVSASHNPFSDNGVKLFGAGGHKLADDVEAAVAAAMGSSVEGVVAGDAVGRMSVDAAAAADAYVDHVVAALEGRSLGGVRLVVDCANGAASPVAGEVLRRAGADVIVLHAQPDGTNINHGCGSTYPEALQEAVRSSGAALGLALDGDADRVVAVAEDGSILDGDVILALCAVDLRERALLANDTLVVTVMSNLGLRVAMAEAGVTVVETKVGDRYVLEAMEAGGHALGGEQSGHVIFGRLATTGDGLLTGVLLADLVARRGRPLSELASSAMTRFPQVLRNVRAERSVLSAAAVKDAVATVEASLAGEGRVLLRPSGTEPLLRVMVEARTADEAEAAVARIVAAVELAAAPDV